MHVWMWRREGEAKRECTLTVVARPLQYTMWLLGMCVGWFSRAFAYVADNICCFVVCWRGPIRSVDTGQLQLLPLI